MKIRLLRNGILLRISNEPPRSQGGLLLMQAPTDTPREGLVVLTGPGYNGLPVQCVPGDTVLYNHGASCVMEVEGEEYTYVSENNLIAVK